MKNKRWKLLGVLGALFAGVILLSGCGKRAEKAVSVEYMYSGGIANVRIDEAMKVNFEKKHSGIKVKLNFVSNWGAYESKILTTMAAGSPPDVVALGEARFAEWTRKGLFLDLAPYLNNDAEFQERKKDIYPVSVFGSAEYKGGTYALPAWQNVDVVFYNKDLFDKAGLAYPDDTWDLRKFSSVCKQLTIDKNNDGRPDQFGAIITMFIPSILWLNGASILNEEGNRCIIDSPEAVEILKWFSDLGNKEHVVPIHLVSSDQDAITMFMSGRVAMCLGGHYLKSSFTKIKDFKWDVALIPKGNKGRVICDSVVYWAVPKGSKNPGAAWELIKYMTGPETQTLLCKENNDMPILKSVLYSKYFLTPGTLPDHKKVFIESLSYARHVPTNLNGETEAHVGDALELAFLDPPQMTMEKAVKEAKKKVEEFLGKK